ncbi:MAG: RNA polymerase sigma factor [Candidatus Riflebacteria bacterium]|nr:RNA polymerase sigma factor [Candidatus Riflebacteria bacterium]
MENGLRMSANTGTKSDSRDPSDESLMELVRRGDIRSFRKVFSRNLEMVIRYSTALCGNPEDAKDVAQEVFTKVYVHRNTYQSGMKFRNWLLAITRNSTIDRLRKQNPTPMTDEMLEMNHASHNSCDLKSISPKPDDPLDLFLRISSENREILLLRVVEGLSYAEISTITGVRPDNLRKIICRTLAKLRSES